MDFDAYFSDIYGTRWSKLRSALENKPSKVLLENPFAGLSDYSLDEASLYPVRVLQARPGDRIADFCSAPGGKLLALVFSLAADMGDTEFVASDLSPARVSRLKAVLHDCLPPEVLARVHVRRGDASLWGKRAPDVYDRILLDVPCSGERHLVASPLELERWSLKGSKRLAIRQHALLCSALDSLKPGGRLVYSTCSISPMENDGVIERLHESRSDQFRVLRPKVEFSVEPEITQHGRIFLPDVLGCGPIYAAVVEKI